MTLGLMCSFIFIARGKRLMDEMFRPYFMKKYVPTLKCSADPAVIEKYKNILPENLLGMWRLQGWSGYHNGLLWLINPDEYHGLLMDFLAGTELEGKGEFYCIAKSAFGAFQVYNRTSGSIFKLSPIWGAFHLGRDAVGVVGSAADKELEVFTYFAVLDPRDGDIESDDGGSLFDAAFERLGHLKPNEVYGFEPLLSLGGRVSVECLSKLNDKVHLSIVRQFAEMELKYF